MGRNILKSSLDNAKFSIVFQIIFRCITFILNAFIIRVVGQEVLGIMNVRLLLLESTLVFLSREPLLKACLTDTKSHNWTQVINQFWLSVPISAVLGIVLNYIWTDVLSTTDEHYLIQYRWGCYAIVVSCIIGQITHIPILVSQSFCFVKLKVVFETIYITVRTVTFVVLVLRDQNEAINAFSIAQLLSSLILFALYYGFFYWYIEKKKTSPKSDLFKDMNDFKFESIRDFFPKIPKAQEAYVNKELCVLTVSFAKQSIVKQVLTEGERYVMSVSPVLTFSEQSMYDIVNNLGSLAARFIFRPIEESAYFYFTQMLRRDQSLSQQDKKCVVEAATVLSQLLKVVTSIGLVVIVFGYTYSHSLLYLYGGRILTEDMLPTVLLRSHCFAVLLLAVNGVTECYVFATMDNKQLDRYNYIMVLFSVTFLLISYGLTNMFGPVGFILANCFNMTARIIHSVHFISNQYKTTKLLPLQGIVPGKVFIAALVVSGLVTSLSEGYVYQRSLLLHVGIGGVCFVITSLSWAYENKVLLKLGVEKYKRRQSVKLD
ncbi:PREDICTED: protein RFT1 homolog [Nicrophorus vespilloides]|uniref:Protein RFT1 homolog n=1 Tax=Nicrophorus vespilloides TaxID=110193 RepID=A0ABM1NH54_NICVS|nr:PREDICTED: protein RFT1 homolog [Nicrophorus vespilloides]